ncbi:hypothetical protein BDR03DRAFT_936512 [Suillus americanus]|nr:hypothetical protein BDR03DRAFT_936512 [Suillus americanus]
MYIDSIRHTEGEGMRHASGFHQHQTIEEHFSFLDKNKYVTLSAFLENHYREVLISIQTLTAELAVLRDALILTDSDFTQFHFNKKLYLDSLKEPPQKNFFRSNMLNSYINWQGDTHIEIQLKIEKHWAISGETYKQYKPQASQHPYHTALDELEHLVIMQLFELSKLSLSGIDV